MGYAPKKHSTGGKGMKDKVKNGHICRVQRMQVQKYQVRREPGTRIHLWEAVEKCVL